ncbi:MAG: AAA family ATPase [Candidatus Peribacteraceae bacterium]|nr:AAA family ATPase [Candidatus Peribacteraceae bacterium]
MKPTHINLRATDTYCGVQLMRLFFSLPAGIAYVLLFSSIVHFSLLRGDRTMLVVGAGIMAFTLFVLFHFVQSVLLSDAPYDRESPNLADTLSAAMVDSLIRAGANGSLPLLKAALSTSRGEFILGEMGITKHTFLERFEVVLNDHVQEADFLVRAKEMAQKLGEKRVDANIVLYLFFQLNAQLQTLLNELDLSSQDLRNIMQWEKFHYDWLRSERAWSPRKLVASVGMIGRGWVMGYTQELDSFSTDLSEAVRYESRKRVVSHRQKLKDVLHILSRSSRQNVLLLGKPGVGKQTLVRNLASVIHTHEVEHALPYTRILLLHTEQLLSGAQRPDAVLLSALAAAQKAGKFIFVLDNLPLLLKSESKETVAVLMKFLQSPAMSLIAVADAQDYHVLVKKDPLLDEQFEKVLLDDASDEETLLTMMTHYFTLEDRDNVHMTYRSLKGILELSKRYVANEGFPGKAIAVMDDAVLAAHRRGSDTVTEDDVREVVSLKAHMDVTKVSEGERDKLLNLEQELQRHIIGQRDALAALVNALKRARMGVHDEGRPLGTFLFLGPTGVGKTQTAKVLAKSYFGSEEQLIRLDMNEYSGEEAVKLLVGSPDVSDALAEGYLARRVQEKPFSLILLDEIEKAHPKVLNVFLQILDEGRLTDSLGVKTDFRNAIIIATSNAGALFVRDFVQKHGDAVQNSEFKKVLVDTILKEKIFTPEFVNRFDEVLLFRPLSFEEAKRVSMMMLDGIIAEMAEKRGVRVRIEEDVVAALVERGFSREFGAREMRRTIVDTIENYLADYMLRQGVKRGDEILIRRSDLQI